MPDNVETPPTPKKRRGNPNWRKGTSQNPGGKPKSLEPITVALKDAIKLTRKQLEEKKDNLIAAQIIARRLILDAMNGDKNATKQILDRLEGKQAPVSKDASADDRPTQVVVPILPRPAPRKKQLSRENPPPGITSDTDAEKAETDKSY
jgi:hypothetical protein